MPRLIAILLCYLLAAPAWGQEIGPTHPVMMGARKGLVRSGLVGAWNLSTVNLLRWSEDQSKNLWNNSGSGLTVARSSTIDPIGTYNAFTLTANSIASQINTAEYIVFTAGVNYTLSAWIRSDYSGAVRLGAWNGAAEATPSSDIIPTTTWTRYTYSFTLAVGGTGNAALVIMNQANTPTVDVFGFQLNEGSTALPYQATTDGQRVPVGTTGSLPIRREIGGAVVYDPAPSTLSKYTYSNGETRAVVGTNLLTYSEQFDNAAWQKRGTASVTANAASAPDGSATADLIFVSTGINDIYQYNIPVIGSSIAPSVYIKKVTTAGTLVILNPNGEGQGSWNVDLSLLSLGWERVTSTHPAVTVVNPFVPVTDKAGLYFRGGTGNVSFYAWGAQLNPGTLPDRYTKTEGVALEPGYPFLQLGSTAGVDTNDPVRRLSGMVFDGVDDYLRTVSNFAHTTPGAITVVAANTASAPDKYLSTSGESGMFMLVDNTRKTEFYFSGKSSPGWHTSPGSALWTINSFNSVTSAWDASVFSMYENAALSFGPTASTGSVGTSTSPLWIGIRSGSQGPWAGTISYVLLYSKALSAKEVRQNHNTYLKPAMSSVGISLP